MENRKGNAKCPLQDDDWNAFFADYSISPREGQIIREVVERDHGVTEMSRELNMAVDTVRSHLKRLYRKLCVQRRVGLTMSVFSWYANQNESNDLSE